jgi:DNA-binding transcriptional regulator GbsR (MarR family)
MSRESHAFVERMGGALTQAGLPRVPSLVFSALLVDDDGRMTSAELAETLEVSPASVSGAVNYLAQLGMIRRERERGSRRDVYVVDDDAWHGTLMRRDQLYAPMVAALTAGLRALGESSPAHERLLLTREFLTFVDDEMSALAGKWEKRRAEITAHR